MKHTKRFFALLLVFALALGVGVFAIAEEAVAFETEADAERIPADWLNVDNRTITDGEKILLSVEGLIPEEYAGWDVSYEWTWSTSYLRYPIEDATGPTLHISRRDAAYPDGYSERFLGTLLSTVYGGFFCEAKVRNAAGDEVNLTLYRASITVNPNLWGCIVNSVKWGFTLIFIAPFALIFGI